MDNDYTSRLRRAQSSPRLQTPRVDPSRVLQRAKSVNRLARQSLIRPKRAPPTPPIVPGAADEMHVEKTWMHDGKELGTESMDTVDAIGWAKKALEARLDQLKNEEHLPIAEQSPNRADEMLWIERQLDGCEKYEKMGRSWLSSNYYRSLTEGAADAKQYQRRVNRAIPGLINCAKHKMVYHDGKETEFLRVGICAALEDGFHSQYDYEEMLQAAQQGPKGFRRDQMVSKRKTKTVNRPHQEAVSRLQEKGERSLSDAQEAAFGAASKRIADMDNVERTAAAREAKLNSKMLQLLAVQMERSLDKVEPGKPFVMAHLAFLNPEKDDWDSRNGWVHNEKNQMLDMKWIYDKFDGKTITFDPDAKGPYLDGDKVVLPFEPPEGVDSVELNTVFMNCSVQGCTHNHETQKEVNKEAFAQLDRLGITNKSIEKAKKMLAGGESSYFVAEELAEGLNRAASATSIGCLSAKDRTGFIGARLHVRELCSKVKNPRKRKKMERRLTRNIFNPKGLAAQNAERNGGFAKLKVPVLKLPGMTDRKSLALRVKQLIGTIPAALGWGGRKIKQFTLSGD